MPAVAMRQCHREGWMHYRYRFQFSSRKRESERRCTADKTAYDSKVTDKTCCMHAEERAIMDALRQHPDQLLGSTLYFIRLDEDGNPRHAGAPYCTLCSKLALDSGVAFFCPLA